MSQEMNEFNSDQPNKKRVKSRADNSIRVFVPIIVILSMFAGALLMRYFGRTASNKNFSTAFFNTSTNSPAIEKLKRVYRLIDERYVDSVNINQMVEKVIPDMLSELDPHSVYIPAKNLEEVNEDLDGSFVGIGVQFNIQKDTVMVVDVISGGPSENVGILPGDRIVRVNDSLFVGPKVTNDLVLKKLRGEKGSEVALTIRRNGVKGLLVFNIQRGDIPVNSVDVSYMLKNKVGYIKVSRFGKTTYDEFITALSRLSTENGGMTSLIVDLRGNGGGYMEIAIRMLEQFLPKGEMVVYTEGKAQPKEEYKSSGRGSFTHLPLAVLIDDWSASASEIFSGAIQDNDRGIIVGRRSFGKGLVQQQMPLPDGSAMRLTIARYHTPSGRCIQKPYTDEAEYGMDIYNRMNHGEFTNADSIKQNDSLIYHTRGGRVVYGGGGIMPDYFVPADTTGVSTFFSAVVNPGYIYQFAFQYIDANRAKLKSIKGTDALIKYLDDQDLMPQFIKFVEQKGVVFNAKDYAISKSLIKNRIYAYIARNSQGEESFYRIFESDDNVIAKAIEEMNKPLVSHP